MRTGIALLVSALLPIAAAASPPDAGAAKQQQNASFDHDPASLDPVTGRPLYYLRELKKEELEGRSLRELSLIRNWIFARAGNSFRKEWLHNFFDARPWYRPREAQDLSSLTGYDKKNAALVAAVESQIPDSELRRRRAPLVESLKADPGYPHAPANPYDVVELGLIAARLGEWVEPKPGAVSWSPLEDPDRLDKLLTLKELEQLSRRDLRLLRNMIYARHGRPFKSQFLDDYFATMHWYKADPKYTDARLTKIDRKNIKIVQSLERKLGGALSDREHLEEEYGIDIFEGA